ncbi:L-tartrate dehydratase subunit beta [Escherichia coli]|uniref:L(+)-tartrate dehydratase subunit beta n=1 Tax=Escherichia coli TaxID=562 RepID=A0A2X1JTH4_ECOLX|nr:L-tartrate dehydratase subunit beta [Escherichia coli]
MKKILTTPIKAEDLQDIRVGDVIYLTGTLVTCRDVCHRRLIELKTSDPLRSQRQKRFSTLAPSCAKTATKWEMVSVRPDNQYAYGKF